MDSQTTDKLGLDQGSADPGAFIKKHSGILGNLQCIDLKDQCFYGQESVESMQQDKRKEGVLRAECKIRKGGVIRCCPLGLINVPYLLKPYEIPFSVKVDEENRKYKMCPEKIKSACFREDDRNKANCIQEVCNDAGYRVAGNFYEICKAHQLTDIPQDIPDCPINGCWGNRFRIPEDIDQALLKPQENEDLQSSLQRKRRNTISEIQELENDLKAIQRARGVEGFREYLDDSDEAELERQLQAKKKELEDLNSVLDHRRIDVMSGDAEPKKRFCISLDFFKGGLYYPIWTIICALIAIAVICVNLAFLPNTA